ncbi:MAG: vitamin K epoxide reductase family protein [Fimbriimonadaceae bacterium]
MMVPGDAVGVESESGRVRGTYNHDVKAVLLNRIAMVLSIVGIYIAGVLAYSSARHVEVPCSINATTNCALVTNSVAGKLFGIPVSYLGLLTYAVILGLAIMRARASGKQWDLFSKLGFWLTGLGLAFSLYLQTVSISQLGQKCEWCISSAVTMLALFVVHGMISQIGRPDAVEEPTPGLKKLPKTEMTLVAGASILAMAALGFTASGMTKEASGVLPGVSVKGITVERLLSNKAKVMGTPGSKIVVVEVADILCPACRKTFPDMKKLYEANSGKMLYSYVAMPLFNLPGHENSIEAAMVAEYAAENQKFWDYMEAAFDPTNDERVKTVDGVVGIAGQIGLDTKDLKKRMDTNLDTSLLDKVNADFNFAVSDLKINGTPSFLLSVNGGEFKAYNFEGLTTALKSPDVAQYLK